MDLLYRFARSALLFHKLSGRAHHEALGAGDLKFHLEQRVAAHGLDRCDDTVAKRLVHDPVADSEGRGSFARRFCRGRRGDRIGTRRALARRVLLLVAAGLGIAIAVRDVELSDVLIRDLLDKAGDAVGRRTPVEQTLAGAREDEVLARAGERDVAQPALLLHFVRLADASQPTMNTVGNSRPLAACMVMSVTQSADWS